jgi:hypothetical protein
MAITTKTSGAIVAGPAFQTPIIRNTTVAEKIIKVKIIYKCRVGGAHKSPGDIVEGPESAMKYLVGLNRATLDMTWQPPQKKAEKKAEK